MTPTVSVIVPSYQGAALLPGLMESLSAQKSQHSWEVVVVLDGSTDASAAILRDWQGKLPLKFLARDVNRGRSATLNEGFAVASGSVLIRCDDDLMPGPAYVQRFGDLVAAEPGVGVVGLARNQFPETAYARVYGRAVDARFRQEAYAAPQETWWRYWAGNCAVHREMWEQVGPYDERFREYGWEDVDWGFRLVQSGGTVRLDPTCETTHRVAATTAAVRFARARASGLASVRFRRTHGISEENLPAGAWNSLVRAASPVAGARLGRITDAMIRVLPRAAGRRVVDLGVQASYERGRMDAATAP